MSVTLNKAQQAAVDHIYGPLLVLAGPGTGKTQLLSTRVAAILEKTDVDARNILCLTFTESGAQNMRERLRSLIGDAAYDVAISTYHSFGSDIIKNYAEYFQTLAVDRTDDIRLERPVDELTQIQIVERIIAALPFDSTMLSARYYVKSVVGTISDLKQHLITPDQLRDIAHKNLQQIDEAQPTLDEAVNTKGGFSRKKAEVFGQYAHLLEGLSSLEGSLISQASGKLLVAYQEAEEMNSTKPLTAWKNEWLHKDGNDKFTLTDRMHSERLHELANVYQAYQDELRRRASYDFDDMILRAIDGLKNNDELRFNLQERYQFILLDEFQDTNPSQFELVQRIADHPVHEGRPNIMAVGDDDQAIFAFQGAHVGNMKEFLQSFRDVDVINLTENYRSHADILHVAHNIAEQIEDRLHRQLQDITKILQAKAENLPTDATIARHEFGAEASEFSWVGKKVKELVDSGVSPSEIAVLAPRHAILENLVPFLNKNDVPLSYEKRENILETEIVAGLRLSAQLLDALANSDSAHANKYFPLVLSQPHWGIAAEDIWKINWQLAKYDESRNWAEIALDSPSTKQAVLFFLSLSTTAATEPLELTLDKLVGTTPIRVNDNATYAPLKSYYFDKAKRVENALSYYEAISHLSVIRARLRDHQANTDTQLTLQDFLEFFTMYEAAEASLINSHPIAQSLDAVQLMTAYKSKGLEFEHVFILHAHDDVWGGSGRGGNNMLALPANLSHIRYVNSSEDERRRLFFVALTRARHGLYITSHTTKDTGKRTVPLKYLAESDGVSAHLPEHAQTIISNELQPDELAEDTETLWQAGQVQLPADFRSLIADRLSNYRMSPTHLNSFINTSYGGPEDFLVGTLLRFPQAPNASGEYGTAVHNTLEWYQNQSTDKSRPTIDDTLRQFDKEMANRYMTFEDRTHAREKGHASLQKYLSSLEKQPIIPAKAEVNFYSEGVLLGDAHLSGKIDRLEINDEDKTVAIVDYKTGKPLTKWGSDIKSITYKQQLYFYKFLIKGSSTWKDYSVESARLEFVEPDKNGAGELQPPLYVEFNADEEAQMKQLIASVWKHIMELDFPDISDYDKSPSGTKKFIESLTSIFSANPD